MVSITLLMKALRRVCSALRSPSWRDLAVTSATIVSIISVTVLTCCSRLALASRRASTRLQTLDLVAEAGHRQASRMCAAASSSRAATLADRPRRRALTRAASTL